MFGNLFVVDARKFNEGKNISADSVYTAVQDDHFLVKGPCKTSMKKELRTIRLHLNINTGYVNNEMCSCPAGLSGYCNHVMAQLLELADYLLNQLQNVTEELACTSKLRQWGIPGQSSSTKDPIMSCIIQKEYEKKGISSTLLYNPRINDSRENDFARFTELENKLRDEDLRIGYAHCMDASLVATKTTKHGEFVIGSPLSFQLATVDFHIKFVANVPSNHQALFSNHEFTNLPLVFHSEEHEAHARDWILNEEEILFLKTLLISAEQSNKIEQKTIKQNKCEKWFKYRKNRITTSVAHKVYTRQRNFDSVVNTLITPKPRSKQPQNVKDAMEHGIYYTRTYCSILIF